MREKKKNKMSVFTWAICIILALYCLTLIIPTIWGFISSFKDKWEFRDLFSLPKVWHYENYTLVFNKFYVEIETTGVYATRQVFIFEMIWNSLLYSIGLSFLGTFVTALMSYLTSRFNYKFSKFVYSLVIVTMILPIVGSLPSELNVSRSLGLYDNPFGLMLMKSYFFGLYYLVFYEAFKGVPMDYSEAAKIDGAGNVTIMFRIMFPFIRSAFLSIVILKFIGYWNDYQTPLLFMPSYPTLAYGLYHFANEFHDNDIKSVPTQLAACFMLAIPVLIVFLIFQERLMGNLSMGGLKG